MLIDAPGAFMAAFAVPAVYTSGETVTNLAAIVEHGAPWREADPELRQGYSLGLVRLGQAWIPEADLSAGPVWGDTLALGGQAWDVEAARSEGSMWAIHLSQGTRGTEIAIQARTEVEDASGFSESGFATVASMRGMMRAVSGQEAEDQGSTLARTVYRLRIPAWPGLTTAHRLLAAGKSLDIVCIDDVLQRGRVMLLDCVETAAREAR